MAADDRIPRSIYEQSPNSRITKSSVIFYVLIFVAIALLVPIRNMNTSSSELSFGLPCLKTPGAGETITSSSTFEEGDANPLLPKEENAEKSIDEENEDGGTNPQLPIEENIEESIDEEIEHGETNTTSSTLEKGDANPQLPIKEKLGEESIDEENEDSETNYTSSTSEDGGANPQLPIEENTEESIDEEIEDGETNTTSSTSEEGRANPQLPIDENLEESIGEENEDGETNYTSSTSTESGANPQRPIEKNTEESIDEENEDVETNTTSTLEEDGANPQLPIKENTEESIDEENEDGETNFTSSTLEGGVKPQLPTKENKKESIDKENEHGGTNTTSSTFEEGGTNPQLAIEENIDEENENGESNYTSSTFKEGIGANPQLPSEENSVESIDEENEDPLIPPPGMTKAKRMTWFREQLPKLEILKSSNYSSTLFHNRVLSFLSQNCSTFFHAIWLSPAKFFGEREFMTMDTLLKVHPQGCLMILSRSMDSELGKMILKPLVDRGLKVEAVTPDLPFLVKDTPAEAWLEQLKSGDKDPGYIPLSQNLSNLMRLAVLYKYGGVYLDTDLIFIKDLSHLRNAIGAQAVDPVTKKWLRLNNAVLIFDKNHPLLRDFLEEFALTFNGSRWGYNGPYMVSRVIARVGNPPGYNLTILPPKAFYPVDWNKIPVFYKKPENETGSAWVENKLANLLFGGETYTLHLWNKRTRDLEIEEGSVMARLFSDHCIVCYNIART